MRYLGFFLLILVGIPVFFLHLDGGSDGPFSQLGAFVHLGFFVVMGFSLSRVPALARRGFLLQVFLVMLAVFFVGGTIELIQPHFGRGASWRDVGLDLVGGFLGVMFLGPARHRVSRGLLVCGQLGALALGVVVLYDPVTTLWDMWRASSQFPVLGDFETRLERKRWSSGEIHEGLARHGERSLRVFLGRKKYAGTALQRSFGDWRGYTAFAFSLYNPDPDPLPITVSIRDRDHSLRGGDYHDRFNRTFTMVQGWNEVHIPVADIEQAPSARTLDLTRLTEVVIFTVNPPAPRLMYLDHVRLIR